MRIWSDTAETFAVRREIHDLAREIGGNVIDAERAAEIERTLLRFADICTYCRGSGSAGDEAAFPEPARGYPCERCDGTGRHLVYDAPAVEIETNEDGDVVGLKERVYPNAPPEPARGEVSEDDPEAYLITYAHTVALSFYDNDLVERGQAQSVEPLYRRRATPEPAAAPVQELIAEAEAEIAELRLTVTQRPADSSESAESAYRAMIYDATTMMEELVAALSLLAERGRR